jgi:hypothetical protein
MHGLETARAISEEKVPHRDIKGDWTVRMYDERLQRQETATYVSCDDIAAVSMMSGVFGDVVKPDTSVVLNSNVNGTEQGEFGKTVESVIEEFGLEVPTHEELFGPDTTGSLKRDSDGDILLDEFDLLDVRHEVDDSLIVESAEAPECLPKQDLQGILADNVVPLGDNTFDNRKTQPFVRVDPPDPSRYKIPDLSNIDPVDLSHAYESTVFRNRDELGLSVDRFQRTYDGPKGTKRVVDVFQYRKRDNKKDSGAWKSRDYVNKAVASLYEFDALMFKSDLDSLDKAATIAKTYFTDEARNNAEWKISRKVRNKFRMVDTGRLKQNMLQKYGSATPDERSAERRAILNSYDSLLSQGAWSDLRYARDIANRYFTNDARRDANATIEGKMLAKAVEIGEMVKHGFRVDENSAKNAFAKLATNKLNKEYCLGLAQGIAEVYLPAHVTLKTVVMQNDARGITPQDSLQQNNIYFKEARGRRNRPTREIAIPAALRDYKRAAA